MIGARSQNESKSVMVCLLEVHSRHEFSSAFLCILFCDLITSRTSALSNFCKILFLKYSALVEVTDTF